MVSAGLCGDRPGLGPDVSQFICIVFLLQPVHKVIFRVLINSAHIITAYEMVLFSSLRLYSISCMMTGALRVRREVNVFVFYFFTAAIANFLLVYL